MGIGTAIMARHTRAHNVSKGNKTETDKKRMLEIVKLWILSTEEFEAMDYSTRSL